MRIPKPKPVIVKSAVLRTSACALLEYEPTDEVPGWLEAKAISSLSFLKALLCVSMVDVSVRNSVVKSSAVLLSDWNSYEDEVWAEEVARPD